MNKKFITCALAAMMMTSLAIPASAADATNSDYGNTTDVVLVYDDDIPGGPSDENAFTIKIPAQIDLEAEENGDKGVILSGTGDIEFSGMIGQNDFVELSIFSENNYQLVDNANGKSVAHYGIVTTTDSNGIELKHYDSKYDGGYFCSFLTSDFSKLSTDPTPLNACETRDMSDNYAQAFQGNGSITMTFQNNDDNEIFGKGEYNDTLTFTYRYNYLEDYEADSGDPTYTTEDYSTVNINNGDVNVINSGDNDTDRESDYIICDNDFKIFIDENGDVDFETLKSMVDYTNNNFQTYQLYIDNVRYVYSCWVEDGVITDDSTLVDGEGTFNSSTSGVYSVKLYTGNNVYNLNLEFETHFTIGDEPNGE